MSRTKRRTGNHSDTFCYTRKWVLRDDESDAIHPPSIDPKSKEGKKRLAVFHSDKYIRFKEPGPAWFRNLFTERPQRREAKRQLDLYLRDPETVVILNAKDKLDYWT